MITAKEAKELATAVDEYTVKRISAEIQEAAKRGDTNVDICCNPEDATKILNLLRNKGFTAIYNEYTLMLEVSWDD